MKARVLLLIMLMGLATAISLAAEFTSSDLKSPDGQVVLTFKLTGDGQPVYTVDYQGKPVILESGLGLELKNGPVLNQGLKLTGATPTRHDETWTPVAAERSPLRDHYNQLDCTLTDVQGRALRITFRAYDEGAAWRYTIPTQKSIKDFTISRETTEFRFTGNHAAWPVYAAQGQYKAGLKLADVKKNCQVPLTVEMENGPTVAVGEAGLIDYARLRLQPAGKPATLAAQHEGEITGAAPFSSPWRFVMIGDTPGQLLEHNCLVLNLNEPSIIKDTSWIKPGKVIREASLSTAGGKACVDFAAQMGLQYVEYDAGWYGYEYDRKSDASGVHLDPRRSKGPLDLQEVIDYGKSKGIGVILYVNHLALEKQADQVFSLYEKWGVKGVKFGFVNVGPQQWSKWNFDHIKKAADHHLMVDIHDEYRQTGISRTLPNLMTTEGVGGDEEFPPAEHQAALPFTRALCGTFDNTICMFDARLTHVDAKKGKDGRKTRCFQLAKAVTVFSPWQFIYWYDRPEAYHGEPELDFWKTIPTTWDETKVVNGAIGKYVTEARRTGEEWYVGTINASEPRTLQIPLAFLKPGQKYAATIYSDDPAGQDLTKVVIEKKTVDAGTVIKANLTPIGGHAMRIVPLK